MATIIGKIISDKSLNRNQVDEIRKKSVYLKKPIQDVLIDSGLVDEEEYFRTAMTVFSGPVIDREEEIVDATCAELFPYSLAKRYGIFPVRRESKGLLLAMSNPHDLAALEDIRFATELPLNPALCLKSQITELIKEYYVKEKSARDLLARAHNECAAEIEKENFLEEIGENDIGELHEEDADLLSFVNRIVADAVDARASDIHIEPQDKSVYVRYRIDGYLKKIIDIPKQLMDRVLSRVKILAKLDIAEKRKFQDGRIGVKMDGRDIDLRVSVIPAYHGEKAVIRILDTKKSIFTFDELGMGPQEKKLFARAINRPQGVVLLTGPTGSGKTTTIYSALHHMKDETRNIVTVEDPVEYLIDGATQVQLNRIKDITFANCLRSILRQDPDVIFVGEIRDQETAEVAFQASLTGHMVFSSLHTNDSVSSIVRLMDIGLEPYLIASSMNLIVSQRLVRAVCPDCRGSYVPEKWLLDKFRSCLDEANIKKFVKGKGCRNCQHTGYLGRTSIFEMLDVNQKVKSLIANRASQATIFSQAVTDGMKTLAQAGIEKVAAGITTLEEVSTVADVSRSNEDISIFDLMQAQHLDAGSRHKVAAL